MASTGHVVYAAIVALLFWTAFGAVVLRRLVTSQLVLPFAPIVGWAVHNAVAIPIFFVVPLKSTSAIAVALLLFAVAVGANRRVDRADVDSHGPRVPIVAFVLAALLACACAAAILPKLVGDAVVLADPIFDHAKVSLVDDIARLGLPPGNPYLAGDGGSGRLAYYYLWHFSAAQLVRALHVGGWEADAAMTFFSAFAALAVMMGLAVRFSRRPAAAIWVTLFAASSSIRNLSIALLDNGVVDAWTNPPGGFAGWLFQSSWVPQHVAAAACVSASVYLMSTLAGRGDAWRVVTIALLVAAGFESSTWIGGVVFAVAAVVLVPLIVWHSAPAARLRIFAALAAAGALAAIVASPFLRDQFAAATLRQGASPVTIEPFGVLGDAVPEGLRRLLDVPAYWLVLLPMELTAVYLVGIAAMRRVLRGARDDRRLVVAFVALTWVSLACAGLLASTLADNNDLAWRAVLLASTVLIAFAAAGLANWIHEGRRAAALLAIVAILLGLPEAIRLIDGNLVGTARPGFREFANAPALWARVRELSAPDERVANNPLSLDRLTPWPVNVGWALLADRRSCYAAWELDQVYTSVPHDRLREIDERQARVFAGTASREDLDAFAANGDCKLVVVTADDGAWTRDPFARDARFGLVDERADRWRIYRRR